MPSKKTDRMQLILDEEHRAKVDAIAKHLGDENRSAAIRWAIEETAAAIGYRGKPAKKRRAS